MVGKLALICVVMILVGCDRGPTPIIWAQNTLTQAQEVRQGELLEKVAPKLWGLSDSLDGSSAKEHEELLSLANKIGNRGQETVYSFDVLTDGDVHVPGELIIIVTGETIKTARWPYGGEY